jgi:alkyl hydroperoxide reductase subunit AhpF
MIPASPGRQSILSAPQIESVRQWWSRHLQGPVRVQVFVDGPGCDACEVTARVLQQLQRASELLRVDMALAAVARREGEALDKLPEVRVHTRTGNVVRFYGTQVGVEVTSLVQTIADASLEHPPLPPDVVSQARALPKGSWLRVFVGSACTHCPGAVRSAVAVALASPALQVEVFSAGEFPELARRFKVGSVPTTVVNGRSYFTDPHSPAQVVEALAASMGP